MDTLIKGTKELLNVLGHIEEPIVMFYTNEKPQNAFAPQEGQPISRKLEKEGKIDYALLGKQFSCLIKNIYLARLKNKTAFISYKQYGCMGGGFHSGMYDSYLDANLYFVSTGKPDGSTKGERYMPTPEAMQKYMEKVAPGLSEFEYCVFKNISNLTKNEIPEFITFFVRPEILSGLTSLAFFTTGDPECVAMPFAPGCGHLVTWPLYYRNKGVKKAVVGGMDLSARKYMKLDEFSFTVSVEFYKEMLKALPDSALYLETWAEVKKKVLLSQKKHKK